MKILYIIILILILETISVEAQKKYKGAEYRTKESYTYGRFEVRIKSAQREGMLTSFFTFHELGAGGTQEWNEIDIEIMGRYNNEIQFNIITAGQTNHVRAQLINFNPALDFHTYAFEWTPQYVAWFVDGVEVYRQTGAHVQTLTYPQKIMMNIWNPAYTNWAGEWNDYILPAFAFYDWVSYYSYNPGSGSYGTGNNFTFQWTDNFNSWNQSKWDKATHTWDGNNCEFVRENAAFNDGNLILCLTDDSNLGYTDKAAPIPIFARFSGNRITVLFSEEIDKVSAEDKNNYIIPLVVVDSVKLLQDQKSVVIYVTGIESNKNYTVITRNIKDFASPPNIISAKSIPLTFSNPLVFPIKINIGGESAGGYLSDQQWRENAEYGYMDGNSNQFSSSLPISGTEEDIIYRTERFGIVVYKVRLSNGFYNLKLMMAENYFSESGKRVFDIYAEGIIVAKDFDIYKMVGKNAAYELNIPNIEVKDEILEINFSAQIDNALLNGIVIENVSTGLLENKDNNKKSISLDQNYPNPFNGSTKIKFTLPKEENIDFYIFDTLGKQVYYKNLGILSAGENEIILNNYEINHSTLSSNVYFYCLRGNNEILTKKLILLK